MSLSSTRPLRMFRAYAIAHPVAAFLGVLLPSSWVLLSALFLAGAPLEPGILVLVYAGLLGLSSLITYWREGRSGVKKLFGGVLKWRVGLKYYLVSLCAIPALTVAGALIAHAVTPSEMQWSRAGFNLVSGAVIINLWEETGWTGFVQSKLMRARGVLKGSLLTALGFVGVHLPFLLREPNASAVLVSFLALFGTALFFRYLIGLLFVDTGGSLLIVGLLHASFNASGSLGGEATTWASIVAVIVITVVLATYKMIRRQPPTFGDVNAATADSATSVISDA
jgi:uncharacterized protein